MICLNENVNKKSDARQIYTIYSGAEPAFSDLDIFLHIVDLNSAPFIIVFIFHINFFHMNSESPKGRAPPYMIQSILKKSRRITRKFSRCRPTDRRDRCTDCTRPISFVRRGILSLSSRPPSIPGREEEEGGTS